MGQQQLLLVILVTIIVGIATVVAINTFGSAADNSNVDAVRNDVASIAASAQGYFMKPKMMGGGGQEFTDMSWADISGVACETATQAVSDGSGGTTDVTKCENENGSYEFTTTANSVDITATPNQAGGTVTATVVQDGISGSITYTAGGS